MVQFVGSVHPTAMPDFLLNNVKGRAQCLGAASYV